MKKETKLARDIERGKTEEDILEQINQREDDFFEYILPQRNSSDVSITTRSRLFEKVSFNLKPLPSSIFFFTLSSGLLEIFLASAPGIFPLHALKNKIIKNRVKFSLKLNIDKLQDRVNRGKLSGSGDNR